MTSGVDGWGRYHRREKQAAADKLYAAALAVRDEEQSADLFTRDALRRIRDRLVDRAVELETQARRSE